MSAAATWVDVLSKWRNRLLVEGVKPRSIGGFTGSAKTAIRYFEEKSIEPGSVPQGNQPLDMATEVFATQKGPRGHAVMRAAQALIDECHKEPVSDDQVKQAQAERVAEKAEEAAARARAAAPAAKSSASAARGNSVATTVAAKGAEEAENEAEPDEGSGDEEEEKDLETSMNRDARDPETDEEEYEDDLEEENPEDAQEEDTPPSRRKTKPRNTVTPIPQQVFVMPPMGRMPKAKNAQPAQPRNRIVRPQSKVRIYKRGEGGRRSLINDYTADEIGSSLQKFLKEYVDPDYGEPSGVTRYEVVEVDDRDQERGAPANYTIESQPQQSNAPMDQLRDTVSLISELREIEEEKASKNAELMTAAKKQAMAGGDWSQMMMLMMMERMFAPKSEGTENVVLKVLEKIGVGGFGGAPPQTPGPVMPPMQTLPPIPFHIPPPPPPPANTAMDKLLELAVAKMANPPSIADQLKELAMLKEIMGGGGGTNVELLAALRAMATQAQQPREATGIDNAVSVFEKLHNVVKVLAPQVNMGGLTGALQGILTPKLTEVLGNTLADGMAKATGQLPGAPAQQQLPQGQPAQGQNAQPQAPAVPPEVHQKLVALNIAQTRPVQVEATVSLIQAMWESPVYKPHLEPVLAALLQGNVEPGQKVIVAILSDAKPILATVDFANDVLRLMAQKAGMPVPEALKVKVTDDVPGLAEPQNAKVIPLTQPAAEQPKPEAPAANGAAAVAATEPPVTQPVTQPANVQSTGRPS